MKQTGRNIILILQMLLLSSTFLFSSPGRSPGRAIVLPPALASASALVSGLAISLTLKFFM